MTKRPDGNSSGLVVWAGLCRFCLAFPIRDALRREFN